MTMITKKMYKVIINRKEIESPIPVFQLESFLSRFLIWSGFSGRYWGYFICLRKSDSELVKEMILHHELFHHTQATSMGRLKYAWKYWSDRKFRLEIEKTAYYRIDYIKYNRFENIVEMNKYIEELY